MSLHNKKILITAGPTREYIDPVRFISNDSSGKMGYAIATAARDAGASVTLVSGPVALPPVNDIDQINVVTAREMYEAAMLNFGVADIIICSAAVADFRIKNPSIIKIKKDEARHLSIELEKNEDILKYLGEKKKKGQLLVGFALETENVIENAKNKLSAKNCDLIIANSNNVIGNDTTSLAILDKSGVIESLEKVSKEEAARTILSVCRRQTEMLQA